MTLLLFAGRYGYHRDELYFLLVAAIARELGGGPGGQTFAAVLAALSGIVLAGGHLLSTTTVDLLVWLGVAWCAVRLLRTGDTRWALPLGLVLGVGMLNKLLPALLALGLIAGVVLTGPHRLLRAKWVLAAAGIALVLAAPNLVWQAAHGFPQLGVAASISAGDSSDSGRLDAFTLQFVIISPYAVPIWIAGLVALLRRPARRCSCCPASCCCCRCYRPTGCPPSWSTSTTTPGRPLAGRRSPTHSPPSTVACRRRSARGRSS
ncbi:glycosyltransferase family 39 protein [Micromonospora sp. DT4]|uniref:glycosyltransferase family 39 protein n=1 Tax=Micromonospora sp. DT4 TaxID=3393438 RepID=UPI003CEEF6FA